MHYPTQMHDWNAIEAEYGASLRRVVASYAPAGPLRDELAQEVALAVWRALPRFRGEASMRTYVLRIAHNVAVRDMVRRRASRTWGSVEDVDEAADSSPSPEFLCEQGRRSERLMAAIQKLPLGERQALTLALEGLKHAEIAEVLGVRENAISVRLHRARARLKTLMEDR